MDVFSSEQSHSIPLLRDPANLMDVAAYVSVSIGYLLTVLLAGSHLTLLGFALTTLSHATWIGFCYYATRDDCDEKIFGRRVYLLVAVTLLTEQTVWFGTGFDWLLPLVMVSIVVLGLDLRRAMLLGSVLLLATLLTLAALDASQSLTVFITHDLTPLVPAFVFVATFSAVVRQQQLQRQRAEELVAQLEAAQAQLRAHANEVEELTVTRERNRMAREIHDTLGHYLTIVAVQLETALKMEEHGDIRLHEELIEARRVATECLTEVRRSVATLRADPTAASFCDALARLVAESEATMPQTEIVLDVEGPVQALAPELRLALYRCAQESLTNIRKYAAATKVLVRVRADDRHAEVTVLDNGIGATLGRNGHTQGFGLLGMRERIELLGGTVSAGPEFERGWRVEVKIPLPVRSSDASSAEGAEVETPVAAEPALSASEA